jgi:7,8-dihydropterin-6-yl-methyl-4-(beta-D-ribofuranosyl)aminobenzene 5'-phosphate synthase
LWHQQFGQKRVTEKPRSTIIEGLEFLGNLKLTIVYDNNPYNPDLTEAWGFACHVDTVGSKILFDTGGDSRILLDNMKTLGMDVDELQVVVLSHIHADHVSGLAGMLSRNRHVDVYVPASFPQEFKLRVESYGCGLVEVKEPLKIRNGAITTGELGSEIKEQSLIINSERGLVVVTGCAHPGIVKIIEKAAQLTDRNIYLVVGGFHLGGSAEHEIRSVVERFRCLGVEKVAPCHCSGDLARRIFRDYFKQDYVEAGVGRIIKIESQPRDKCLACAAHISEVTLKHRHKSLEDLLHRITSTSE